MVAPGKSAETDIIRVIKVIDIGYISIIYLFIGLYLAVFIDKLLGPYNSTENKKKSTIQLIIELILHIWCLATLTYFVRVLVRLIPFPLDGYRGFNHSLLREIPNAGAYTFVLYYFQSHLKNKLQILYDRFT